MEIINSFATVSDPFVIGKSEQHTLFASGLSGTDQVVIEVVTMTLAGPAGDLCCPGPVAFPEVVGAVPLICRNGVSVRMTAAIPWVILNAPQGVPLRARVIASDDTAIISVTKTASDSTDCLGCACEDPACPSVRLPGGGFMFHPGDFRAPNATVPIETCAGIILGYVFPTAGPGHTVEIISCDNVSIGWAANRSDCAPECSLCDVAEISDSTCQ